MMVALYEDLMTINQSLQPPSASTIRDELEQLVLGELRGPAAGPSEEIIEKPRDRYLVGILAPRYRSNRPEEDDAPPLVPDPEDAPSEFGVDPHADGPADATVDAPVDARTSREMPSTAIPLMSPSSFGMTCCVDGGADSIVVEAHWGRYTRERSETIVTEKTGEPRLVWQRQPMGGVSKPLPLEEGEIVPFSPDPELPEVRVRGRIRRAGNDWLLTLWLLNEQGEPEKLRDQAWLFQPELAVRAPHGDAIFRRRANLAPIAGDAVAAVEDRTMQMQYRHQVEFAVGHGVGVHAEQGTDGPACATRIGTSVVPAYEVPATTHATEADFPLLTGIELDMRELSAIPDGEFSDSLRPLITAYDAWIKQQKDRITDPVNGLTPFATTARDALQTCADARVRIVEGIDLLDRDPQAARAFRFANRAMWQQRVHTQRIERSRGGQAVSLEAVDVPAHRSWRLFQLAFVLLNLPSLTNLDHEERSESTNAIADLLWFPTGGGKTEAYLGLTAYTLAIRRLQGTVAGRSGMDGVAVLMRYTLRLLTLQQFQRAAALICACELIRRSDEQTWGATPFRLGLWVGQGATPNTTEQANEVLKGAHGGRSSAGGGVGTPAQLTSCPWCGAAIVPDKHLRVDSDLQRTLIFCGDPDGDCPFTAKQSPREGLPVLVVDEEIYRRLPALLIATVDKFAQLPWKGQTQMLFGQVSGYCPRHGFTSPEINDSLSHPAKNGLPAVATQSCAPLRPPDLIIQDELHLISGPLGTLVGLYETVIDRLCTWEVGGKRVRPKVIASTATVKRATDQIHALFLRQTRIFPPPGLDAGDNFFALQREPSEAQPGRRYIGITAPGRRIKAVLIRIYVAHLAAAQVLYERYGQAADPWMTLVGYFNTLRELGGMRRLVDDDVRARLGQMDERGLARRRPPLLEELTSRKSSTDIPHVLDRLSIRFDPARDQAIADSKKTGNAVAGVPPLDVLLATNMISVGVDVPRLGLMVVGGQPKTTAEYIQATSRVGRSKEAPGLVCTIFNWARPRDLSHYEQFEHYHATFYQHVEALSVTPFAARAIDRGLTALLVAYVRLLDATFNPNTGAGRLTDRTHPYITRAIEDIATRAAEVTASQDVADFVRQALNKRADGWVNRAQKKTSGAQLTFRKKDGTSVNLLYTPEQGDWQLFTCLNSLRDVEPTVDLILDERPLGDEETRPFTLAAEVMADTVGDVEDAD